ncbi:MAG: TROVE domain-containing protein [Bacteroidetes bacterium]|nr:MAG: TROVE domain-containing protein [Bacteroidota bacterium]
MKFNQKATEKNVTTNYMGGKAYLLTPAMELYTAVVATMLDNSYYEKKTDRLARIQALVAQNDPLFVAKLAVYAREKMYLRSAPIVLAVELAKNHKGDDLVGKLVNRVVQRADEITELLSYYALSNERAGIKKLGKLSKQIQKGLAMAFNKFDEYQFAKYNRDSSVKLRDALFIVHPKAKDEAQQALFDKIVSGTLETPYTWETQLSALGQQDFENEAKKQQAKAELWEELMVSGKIGYMATLRNLRNVLLYGTGKAVDSALELVTNEAQVKKAKQLPFRYLSAYAEVEKLKGEELLFSQTKTRIPQILEAVEKAVSFSIDNLPTLAGKTLILTDNSGSMRGDASGASAVSAMSKRTTADIANLFAALYWKKAQNSIVGLFGDNIILPTLKPDMDIFQAFKLINSEATKCGLSTETGIFEMITRLIQNKTVVDRIVIFSDCQIGTGCNWYDNKGKRAADFDALFRQYKKEVNPDVLTYSVDLRGYGNTLFKEGVITIGGWSDKIFDMMEAIETSGSIEEEINRIFL